MTRISRFTPWLTPEDKLEAIFVARESILDAIVSRATQAAESGSRNHTLVVGPRGSGKTHLTALAYYRITALVAEGTRLVMARLPEDPFTIASYAHLLAAIAAAAQPGVDVKRDADVLERHLDHVAAAGGPIVVFLENLDEVFGQIGVDGQRKLRHYLQTSNALLLLATTPILDRSLNEQTSPFYGFFSVIALQEFSASQAQEMLVKMAEAQGDAEFASELASDASHKRIDVVRHLAGSQPRLWSTFYDVMTPENINRVADILFASFDDLTPYYRDRLMSLSPKQRLLIAELADTDHALHVQELSARTDIPQRSVAARLAELKESKWVTVVTTPWDHLLDGRKTYYELAEPLTRLAFQVKDSINKPISLIVKFLSVWLDPADLKTWTGSDMAAQYVAEVQSAMGDDAALHLTRRLSRLADCDADDEALLGQADDAVSELQRGNADKIMLLPTSIRQALEDRFAELPDPDEAALAVRVELHEAALGYMAWVPREPNSSQWIERAENLAANAKDPDEALRLLVNWLSRSWRFEQAKSILPLIKDPVFSIDAANALAVGYAEGGRLAEATDLTRASLVDAMQILGNDHPLTLTARNSLASWLGESGQNTEAIKQFQTLLEDQVRVHGPDHLNTLITRNNLASWLGESGQTAEAIKQFQTLLEDQQRILGNDHPDTLNTRNNLASWLGESGQTAEAIEQFQTLLEDQQRILGPDHPDTLNTRNNLAWWLSETGQTAEAIKQFLTLLEDQLRVLGNDHPHTLTTRNNLAWWLGQSGRTAEAIKQFQTLLEDKQRILGNDHPSTLTIRSNIAFLLGETGQTAEAIKQFQTLLEDQQRVLGNDHPHTLITRNNLARLLSDSNHPAK
ncbi:MAG: tetratricopeptide repeat protein [Propionibacteriaceae bacterium]|jgi:tetratricopeptide (TPR) repeat protein|nr:tetratricopeptide repeat protein [Propionibacteriaceae bacterium]